MAYYYTNEATQVKRQNDLLERIADALETGNTLKLAHMIIMFGEDPVTDVLNDLAGGDDE